MAKSKTQAKWNVSWKQLLVAGSIVLNIAFVVLFVALAGTHSLDSMIMNEGLKRYCTTANDSKFDDAGDETKALRMFTCARGDAQKPFNDALSNYLMMKGIHQEAKQ